MLGIVGNGSSITTLSEAGIEDADVFIAVTGSDELNLLCCMFAKKAGHCHAIARVRNPSYSHELDFIKKQIGISAIINPEMAAAKEISHLLRFPGASKIDTFAGGRVRLIKFALTEAQGLDGVAIREIPTRLKSDILVWSMACMTCGTSWKLTEAGYELCDRFPSAGLYPDDRGRAAAAARRWPA